MRNQCTREDLLSVPEMKDRYDIEYPGYQPDPKILQQLKSLIAPLKVTIVLGTWCGDSKLQVPRFYKILDELDVAEENVKLICVNERKEAGDGSIDHLDIKNIPTFIFTENEVESGRIIESPATTLENDWLEIITKNN